MTSTQIRIKPRHILAIGLTFVSVLTAFAAPAQQLDTGQASEKPPAASAPAPAPSGVHSKQINPAAAPSSTPLFLPAVTYSTGGIDSIFYDNPTWVSLVDVNGDGTLDVLVANMCSTYGVNECPDGSSSVGVLLGNGDGTFRPVQTYASGGYFAFTVIAADVNGDGKPDLLVANGCFIGSPDQPCPTSGLIGVLLGNGDGTFQPVTNYPSGGLLSWIAVADVNGDGKPDLLVSNQDGGSNGQGSVGVLLNKGNGTFQPVQTYSSGGLQTGFVVVADVNADGKPDLLVSNSSVCNNCQGNVGVLLGNGDGTFQSVVTYGPVVAANVLAVADLRNNGKLDLVVNGGGAFDGGLLSVLLGNGDGTFQPAVIYSAGGGYNGPPLVIDLNGDHKLDLATPNAQGCPDTHESACVGVLLGNGDGTFQPAVEYAVGGAALIAAGDVNGDGIFDLVTSVEGSPGAASKGGSVDVLLGNGDGTFQPAASYYVAAFGTTWVGTADVNGDGNLDVLAVSPNAGAVDGQVSVLINNTGGLTATSTTLMSSLNPSLARQPVTFTATVNSAAGPPPNGEVITFTSGSALIGKAPLSGGSTSLTTSSLPVGGLAISAIYDGDSRFRGSSFQLRQVVNAYATSTALVSSLNPSTYGQKVTWTATVTNSGSLPPTGKVNLNWGGYSIGTAALNASGVATLTRSILNADPYPLFAVYSGDPNNEPSTSAILNQVVDETTSTATLSSSPNPSTAGQAVTFTATIKSPTVAATGPVTFTAGKRVLGTAQLADGKAKFTISTLSVGTATVTASYAGDSNISGSLASIIQTVAP
jgi:Bacterial Ig-like domain (group 3)/FG-GAP-like repeat